MVFALVVAGLIALGAVAVGAQSKSARTPTAVISMEKGGEIVLEFFPQDAPKHVENFLTLAKKGFYDGQRVHRVEPKFVVQFGDPQSKTKPMDDPAMGTGGPGYKIKAEFNSRKFERGVLGMARSQDPDSAGTQFFICLDKHSHLDRNYTAFGKVADDESLKTVQAIGKVKTSGDRPAEKVTIKKATVKEAAKA